MSIYSLFRRGQEDRTPQWHVRESADGIVVSTKANDGRPLDRASLLGGWLSQLEDEGFAIPTQEGFSLTWGALYELSRNEQHCAAIEMLSLPKAVEAVPILCSRGSLEDESFSIALDGWRIGGASVQDACLDGAILSHHGNRWLLAPEAWAVVAEILRFARRPPEERNGQAQRLAWGRIRRLAMDAKANLDAFLHKTVVLTPEKLAIGIRKVKVGDDTVIEVQPSFDGAPDDWITRFDRQSSVQARYDIPTADGIVQVVIAPKVRTVLEEIKGLPNRRVAGASAQAFILNPYAALGEDAVAVIDEEQFEEARAAAGLGYERFIPQFERDSLGYPLKVGLLIETASASGPSSSETIWLDDTGLQNFVKGLRAAMARQFRGIDAFQSNALTVAIERVAIDHTSTLAGESFARPRLIDTPPHDRKGKQGA